MYKRFYSLSSDPFRASPDPRFLYPLPQTREALAGLHFGIASRKGFIVLTGEVGTGKTTLLHEVLSSFDPQKTLSAFVFNPRLDVLDFLEFVLADFGLQPVSRTKSGMLLQLNRWLVERYREGKTCIVVVDEAHHLSWELLEEIRLLTNLETSSDKLLQIVLSAQPELETMLRLPNARQIRQRIALWCRLEPLSPEQVGPYIAARLRSAGLAPAPDGQPATLFTPEAIASIARSSRGLPRLINLLCEHALLRGYVEDAPQISAALVQEVLRDLDLQLDLPPDPQPDPPVRTASEDPEMSRAGQPIETEATALAAAEREHHP